MTQNLETETSSLQTRLMALVRAFGLLELERTPCGQSLSPSAAHALTEVFLARSLAQSELGSRLRLEKSTISRLVDQLEERGWVERRRVENDGRMVFLSLTDEGREMAEQLAASRAVFFAQLCERVPPARRGELVDALDLLVEALHAQR